VRERELLDDEPRGNLVGCHPDPMGLDPKVAHLHSNHVDFSADVRAHRSRLSTAATPEESPGQPNWGWARPVLNGQPLKNTKGQHAGRTNTSRACTLTYTPGERRMTPRYRR
jgi:hypothetical protein